MGGHHGHHKPVDRADDGHMVMVRYDGQYLAAYQLDPWGVELGRYNCDDESGC